MVRLKSRYPVARLVLDGQDAILGFREEHQKGNIADWRLMEAAWEAHDYDAEVMTEAGLLRGQLSRRRTPFGGKVRFQIRGTLIDGNKPGVSA